MSVPVPEYIDQRLRLLREEKLRIEGRIAELEMLAQNVTVSTPKESGD